MKYTLLSLSGPDRGAFLQGQMTQDINALQGGHSLPSAWCNPKGRVLITCQLAAIGDRILMAVPASSAESTLKRLQMYRLRAKVDIDRENDVLFAAFDGAPAQDLAKAIGKPTDVGAGRRTDISSSRLDSPAQTIEVFSTAAALQDAGIDPDLALDSDAWSGARIAAGRVDIGAANAEKYTPHMLNLDRVGAISFTKGCYTGQEIVARTEHLGKVKRRVNVYRSSAGEPVNIGDKLVHEGTNVGEVVNTVGDRTLAVVPVELFSATLAIGDISMRPELLPYSLDASIEAKPVDATPDAV